MQLAKILWRTIMSITHTFALPLFMSLCLGGAFATVPGVILAEGTSPWGPAQVTKTDYGPLKVVFDVYGGEARDIESVLDRASYFSLITGADPFDGSIVLVVHGPSINFFGIKNYGKYQELMRRAQSLTVGNVVKIKMCKIAASQRGFEPEDIHGFVEMIPMAEAEIVRLQTQEGHGYMR